MWPFKSVDSLEKSGILEDAVDWHSHILPGVDDGIKTMDDSLEILDAYEKYGYREVWLTPHIMEDYPNTTEDLKARFEELKQTYKGSIRLHLAAENMLDILFDNRMKQKDLLPLGEQGNHLLVETSYINPPMGFNHIIDDIFSAGFFPVLAHPERYRYMDKDDYKDLKDKGVVFQMNLISIVAGFGKTARDKAEWLLDNNMVDLIGSDAHRLKATAGWMTQSPRKAKYLDKIAEIIRNPYQM